MYCLLYSPGAPPLEILSYQRTPSLSSTDSHPDFYFITPSYSLIDKCQWIEFWIKSSKLGHYIGLENKILYQNASLGFWILCRYNDLALYTASNTGMTQQNFTSHSQELFQSFPTAQPSLPSISFLSDHCHLSSDLPHFGHITQVIQLKFCQSSFEGTQLVTSKLSWREVRWVISRSYVLGEGRRLSSLNNIKPSLILKGYSNLGNINQ